MRLGVLDIGSNTVHLLVVDAHRGGHPQPMRSEKTELRLAEHLDDRQLTAAGADALVHAVARAKAAATLADCAELREGVILRRLDTLGVSSPSQRPRPLTDRHPRRIVGLTRG